MTGWYGSYPNMMWGSEWWMGLVNLVVGIVVVADLVLVGVWLWKQIQK